MSREEMRAGDRDRETIAASLKTALDEGRLDLHEYDERLQRTYSAKTYGELEALVTDLPGTIPAQRSQVQPYSPPAAAAPVDDDGGGRGDTWVRSYTGVVAVCVIIWGISCLASGHWMYPWPVWMLIPLIFGLVRQKSGRGGRSRDRRRQRR